MVLIISHCAVCQMLSITDHIIFSEIKILYIKHSRHVMLTLTDSGVIHKVLSHLLVGEDLPTLSAHFTVLVFILVVTLLSVAVAVG